MRDRFDRLVSGVLAASAATVALAVVYGVAWRDPSRLIAPDSSPDYVEDWEELLSVSLPAGGVQSAPVTILGFQDLECSACAGLQRTMNEILRERPEDVRVVYVAHPLSYHRFARAAAQAAECAAEVGALRRWLDAVYSKQDSLGLKSWGAYGIDAEIGDTTRIADCANDSEAGERIEAGLAWGAKIRVTGTPTVLVNGWRYRGSPTKSRLLAAIDAILRGDRPT